MPCKLSKISKVTIPKKKDSILESKLNARLQTFDIEELKETCVEDTAI